jgi:hypothetical protein
VRQIASSSSGYKWIAISEFHDFREIFAIGEKIIALLLAAGGFRRNRVMVLQEIAPCLLTKSGARSARRA